MTTCIATWPTGPVQLEWIPGALPDTPITGAHGFCFSGSEILLCDIAGRGLSIPGGHLERRLVSDEGLPSLHHDLNEVLAAAYAAALAMRP